MRSTSGEARGGHLPYDRAPWVRLVFDADNHYYEAPDAFTRHLDPALGAPLHPVGRDRRALVPRDRRAGQPCREQRHVRPGVEAGLPVRLLPRQHRRREPARARCATREPVRPEYRDRDARLRVLDEQGLVGCWMFPTLGMIYEEPLAHDPEAVCHTFRAFNRWLAEDWGFANDDRLYAAPYLTLADADWAAEEVDWALAQGARMVVMRAAAPTTRLGRRSPFDTDVRPGVVPPGRGRDHRRGPRGRRRGLVAGVRGRRVLRVAQGHRLQAVAQELRHRAGHPRLPRCR